MTDKYEELPECKSVDEFKIGDIVNVYDCCSCVSGRVGFVDTINGFLYVEGLYSKYHFKQCRKLKKKEPRVFWILKPELREENSLYSFKSVCDFNPSDEKHYTKVREIFD